MDVETRTNPFMNALVRGWNPLHSTRAMVAELDGCSEHEVDRMARDLAISPRDLRRVAALGTDACSLLRRRMEALDLDFDEVGRDQAHVLWDLQQLCTLCDSKKRCARDLAADADSPAWRGYCPNEDTFTALKAQLTRLPAASAPALAPAAPRLAAAAAVRPQPRSLTAWLLALALLAGLLLALNAIGPGRIGNLFDRASAPALSVQTRSTRAVTCLDTSCLDQTQVAALETVAAFQERGAAHSSAAEIAATLRAAPDVREIRSGEAEACRSAGGMTSYGPMFQTGCSPGVVQSGRPLGYNSCQSMAAGGVCFLK
jgi:hypothetical protein